MIRRVYLCLTILVFSFASIHGGCIYAADEPNIFVLRDLLLSSEFQRLDEALDRYQRAYEARAGSEIVVETAFDAFATSDPSHEAHLDAWIKTMPGSYTAYLARANYFHAMAWSKRGQRFMSKTSMEQVAGMERFQKRADDDLNMALSLNPKLTLAYSILISIGASGSNPSLKNNALNRAFGIDPTSYLVRKEALYFLLPRWGGSHKEIAAFIDDTRQYVRQNPLLKPLLGYLHYAKSRRAYDDEEYEKAVTHVNAALRNGENSGYYQRRASCFYKLKDYDAALKDYSKAIKLNKYGEDLYLWRSHTYKKLEQYELQFADLNFAAKIAPYQYHVRKYLGHALAKRKQYEEAVASFRAATLHYDKNDYVWYVLGFYLHNRLGKTRESLGPLEKALALDPDRAQYWYVYARALYRLHDCSTITALQRYLSLCETKRDCKDDKVQWGRSALVSLKSTDCK